MKSIDHIPPYAVIDAIRNWVGEDKMDEVLSNMTYSRLHDCWSVVRFGMFVGIERDGHIHS